MCLGSLDCWIANFYDDFLPLTPTFLEIYA